MSLLHFHCCRIIQHHTPSYHWICTRGSTRNRTWASKCGAWRAANYTTEPNINLKVSISLMQYFKSFKIDLRNESLIIWSPFPLWFNFMCFFPPRHIFDICSIMNCIWLHNWEGTISRSIQSSWSMHDEFPKNRHVPGSIVARTLRSHRRNPGSIPGQGVFSNWTKHVDANAVLNHKKHCSCGLMDKASGS